MCGIAGVAGSTGATLSVGPALAALRHRGPDAHGTARAGGEGFMWELGHTRLSIVDLSTAGNQPMANEDGTLVMVFNGEIYNSPELRRLCEAKGHTFRSEMDGEVILHLWEMEGVAALGRLNGIFAVAMADTRSGDVTLGRDPLGVKPLVYASSPGGDLWFASELAALSAMGAPLGNLDVTALAQFLTFLWVPDPRTPYQGARTVEPGRALRWSKGRIEHLDYGEPLVPAAHPIPMARAVDGLAERFGAAGRRQLLADVPIGLMASGGIDSGLLWSATRDSLSQAFTIRWSADGAEGLNEDAAAVGVLEQQLGTPVTYLQGEGAEVRPLPSSGDLFADPAYELTRQIARAAGEQGYKVLLSGQGGDELFAGYRRHSVAPWLDRLRPGRLAASAEKIFAMAGQRGAGRGLNTEYSSRLARAFAQGDPFSGYLQLCSYSTASERAEVLACTESEVTDEVVWQRHRQVFDGLPAGLSFLRQAMALDLAVYLPGLGLSYVDRAGMEFGVEIRVPWLDLDLVRWSLTLPDDLLVRRGRRKYLPTALGARELGRTMARRPKRGFAAPAERLAGHKGASGHRGFRQGLYFARARSVLAAFLGSVRDERS